MRRAQPGCKMLLCGFVAVLFLCQTLYSQDAPGKFAGTWQAQFQGKPFLTIRLQEQAGTFSGTVSHAQIQTDASGALTSAEIRDGEDSIIEAQAAGDVLHLTSKDASSGETTQYELRLTGAQQAELRFVGIPSSITAPKPWKLERTSAAGEATAGNAAQPDASAAKPAATATVGQKLAAAAQTWLAGQFGTNNAASTSTSSSASMTDGTTTGGGTQAKTLPPLKTSDSPLDAGFRKALDALPRRVNDQFEHLGDMVNLVIVGDQAKVQSALDAAGWHVADTDTRESVLKGVLETYQKKDYMTMPMSRLFLFGRAQDFGYEQGEAYAVVASRHHFRIWKAPFTWNGKQVWAGAGTHDIGFEKDQRNGKVTHKIDPAVDGERDHIGQTLQAAEKTENLTYYLPPDPVKEEKNATGGGYHSDGRLLVIVLQ